MTIRSDPNRPFVVGFSRPLMASLLDVSVLFIISLIFSLGPYFRHNSPFPVGFDTIHYIAHMFRAERTGMDYFISGWKAEPLFYHPGYILVAVLIQKITEASFFVIGKFLPIIASSFLAVVFYLITFSYTGNRTPSLLSGFLVSIYPGRMRLTGDLHSCLFAYMFVSVAFLFFLAFLKPSSNELSSHQKGIATVYISLLLYAGYTHIHVFALAVFVSIAFSVFIFIQQLIRPSKGHIRSKALVALSPIIISLALACLLLLVSPETLTTRLSTEVKFLTRRDLPPPPSLSALFFGAKYPFGSLGLLHIWGREVDNRTCAGLDLFNSTLMNLLMTLGVLIVVHRGFIHPKNSSDGNKSTFLFAWFVVNFALIFSGCFGLPFVKAAFVHRAFLLLPIPIFAAIGLAWIIKSLKRFKRTFCFHFGSRSITLGTKKLSYSIIVLLLIGTLVPISYYAVEYPQRSRSHWDEALCSKLEQLAAWRDINRPGRIPIFITTGVYWSLDQALNWPSFDDIRWKYEWMIEIYTEALRYLPNSYAGTCLVYYGELRYLQQGTYTPYQGGRDECSQYAWKEFLSRLEPYGVEKCDIYVLTSIYQLPFDRKDTVEILPGIFLLKTPLTWD